MEDAVGRQVRYPDHHAQPVHLLHHFHAERRKPSTHLAARDPVAELVAAVMGELHAAHAQPEELAQQGQPALGAIVRLGKNFDRAAALQIEEELHPTPVRLGRDIRFGLDDGGFPVGFLDLDQDHVEGAHRALEQGLVAVPLLDRVATGGHDHDAHARFNQPGNEEVPHGRVLRLVPDLEPVAEFPDVTVPFYNDVVLGLPRSGRGENARPERGCRAGQEVSAGHLRGSA